MKQSMQLARDDQGFVHHAMLRDGKDLLFQL